MAEPTSLKLTVNKHGKIQLPITCPAAAIGHCVGVATLKTATAVAANRKKKVLTLGSASFSIPTGQARKVTIKLSKRALGMISKYHTLKALEIVVAHDSRSTPKTSNAKVTLKAFK